MLPWRMAFVPEGQHDRSLARSAWEIVHRDNRPVGYGMIGRSSTQRYFSSKMCAAYSKFRRTNHRIGAQACANHTVPYGTVLLDGAGPRHFVPGYDRTVPPGRKPFRTEALINLALMGFSLVRELFQ